MAYNIRMHPEGHSTWLEVDLGAIQDNYRELQRISQRPVMAIVKANAYGHGLVKTAQALSEIHARWLGVARYEEALLVRQNWISTDLLVLGYTPPENAAAAAKDRIRLTVFDRDNAAAMAARAAAHGLTLLVHVKINTGMNRLGVLPDEALEFIRWLNGLEGLQVEGVFTHFARADEPGHAATDEQIRLFNQVVKGLTGAGIRPHWLHASNSAAVLNYPQARYDLVRCGISLYGLHPSPQSPLPPSFRPALSWKTRLTAVRLLPPGSGVGYNHRHVTRGYERIGTIPVGYADGLRRILGNLVLVAGKLVPVVGTVCMDQCMLQLDSVPDAKVGDEVVIFGWQADVHRSIEDVAATWGTINYEVACAMAGRLPRIYLTGDNSSS